MPIPNAKHKILKELLKDDNKDLLEEIEKWFDASEAKEKVQKANDDLVKQRETFEKFEKEAKEKLANFEKIEKEKDAEIKRLQENMLTDDDKTKFEEFKKSGVSSSAQKEFDAKINKLTDTVTNLTKKIEESEGARVESEKKVKEAERARLHTELDNKLTTAFAEKKITGKNTALALLLAKNQKLAELKETEDGSIAEKYYIVGDDKKFRDATIDELAEYIATTHENLVEPSGNGGSGFDHQSLNPSGGGNKGMQLHEIRDQASAMLEMDK